MLDLSSYENRSWAGGLHTFETGATMANCDKGIVILACNNSGVFHCLKREFYQVKSKKRQKAQNTF
jgi:hypothetical protein